MAEFVKRLHRRQPVRRNTITGKQIDLTIPEEEGDLDEVPRQASSHYAVSKTYSAR
jgi:hypothetical protein